MSATQTQAEYRAQMTLTGWERWVKAGGLEQVEETLGPVKTEPWSLVFEAGWKLGYERSIADALALVEGL